MTLFGDNVESGILGLTSAQSTRAAVQLERYRRFTGGGNQTWNGFFPYGSIGVDAKLYINANGSAATSDTITITTSAGGTILGSITSIGSATGVLRSTTVGLGALTMRASACTQVGPNVEGADVPFQIILSSVDTATDYTLLIDFRRPFKPGT